MALDEHARTVPECIHRGKLLGISRGTNQTDLSEKSASVLNPHSRSFRYFSVACADAAPWCPYAAVGFYVVSLRCSLLCVGALDDARGCVGREPKKTRQCY